MSQLSTKTIKLLKDEKTNFIQQMCIVDEDQETMFKLMATLKPLGLRDESIEFEIVFPS